MFHSIPIQQTLTGSAAGKIASGRAAGDSQSGRLFSGQEMDLRPSQYHPFALIGDAVQAGGLRAACGQSHSVDNPEGGRVAQSFVSRIELRVGRIDTEIEPRCRAVLRARANLKEAVARVAAVAYTGADTERRLDDALNRHATGRATSGWAGQVLVDEIGRKLIIIDRREAAVGAGLPLVAPVVLEAGVDAPRFGQLDAARAAARHGAVWGDVVVHAVEAPAEAGGLALVELPSVALGREVDGALAIDEIDTQRIAGTGRNIDVATEGSRSAELVG